MIMEGEITCPMCRSSRYDFAQDQDMASYMRGNGIRLSEVHRKWESLSRSSLISC